MTNEFISYDQAKALKELGFDENEHFVYVQQGKSNTYTFDAPLWQQAFRFFREKYSLDGSVSKDHKGDFYFIIYEDWFICKSSEDYFPTYEEAQSACLDRLIEIVKNKY